MPARRLLPSVLGALLLTACSDTEPLIDAPSTTTETAAVAAAPALELGDFDPEGDFTLFDPCTEIPPEVLEQAGLGERGSAPVRDGERSVLCSMRFVDTVYPGVIGISGDRHDRERFVHAGLVLQESPESSVPGVYLHTLPGDVGSDCFAAVHTTRGRFVVSYTEPLAAGNRGEICSVAVETLESIFETLGESNGNVDRS